MHIFSLLIISASSCTESPAEDLLDMAETGMEVSPEKSLAVLESIDRASLNSRRHGTPDERMLAYYYNGIVYSFSGDSEQEMQNFTVHLPYLGDAHAWIQLVYILDILESELLEVTDFQ